ncbi:MAG: hypothetical protein ABIP94_10395 [Planctomycetota bacterium]
MMMLRLLATSCLVTTLTPLLAAQQPVPAAAAPARDTQAPKADPLKRAFLDADGGGRAALTAAAEQLQKGDAAGRTRFVQTLQAIAAVAPKVVAAPAPAAERVPASAEKKPAETKPAEVKPAEVKPAEVKPVEFEAPIKTLMATVVAGPAEASQVALTSLAADKETGPAALTRLNERGKAVLEQCLMVSIRKKSQTNAIFAGQYDDLRDYQPTAAVTLLRWAQEAPKGAGEAGQFSGACLRALRDIMPADQATDDTRSALREVIAKAQKAGQQPTFLTAVCALHQYGDASVFDSLKARFEKQLTAEGADAKTAANKGLADLHYQLRDYDNAATYYKAVVDLIEQLTPPPEDLPTVVYNASCSLALAKKTDEAFEYLEKALKLGARTLTKAMIDADHDMNSLREDPRFAKLMQVFSAKADPHGK